MQRHIILLLCLSLASLLLTSCAFTPPLAKVTLNVVDEEGKPVEGANVGICFHGGCLKKDVTVGLTDNNGMFIASGLSSDGQVGGEVKKDGYYYSIFHSDFFYSRLGMWQPWDKKTTVPRHKRVRPTD